MVQDLPEYPIGSQRGSWGITVIIRIRVDVTITSERLLLVCEVLSSHVTVFPYNMRNNTYMLLITWYQ